MMDETAIDAKMMIHKMKVFYKKDLENFSKG
jgi:hypothetical protein